MSGVRLGPDRGAPKRAYGRPLAPAQPNTELNVLTGWHDVNVAYGSHERLDEAEKEIAALREEVRQLREMVAAMWDAPGMPGANAAAAAFAAEEGDAK